MFRIMFGIFILLHSFVHLLYFGHGSRYFELKPGMTWPDGAWAFAALLGSEGTRKLAGVLLILTVVGLVTGALGIFVNQAWWRPVLVGAAIFSSTVYLLLWNGRTQNLDAQGAVSILINMAILAVVLILRWPSTD